MTNPTIFKDAARLVKIALIELEYPSVEPLSDEQKKDKQKFLALCDEVVVGRYDREDDDDDDA